MSRKQKTAGFRLRSMVLAVGIATGSIAVAQAATIGGAGGGVLTFDADLALDSFNSGAPFAVVVNPDNIDLFGGTTSNNAFLSGPVDAPDFVNAFLPVYAVVDCLPGDLRRVYSPGGTWPVPFPHTLWNKANPLFATNPATGDEDRGQPLYCLADMGALNLSLNRDTEIPPRYFASGDYFDNLTFGFHAMRGSAEVPPPFGLPNFLFYPVANFDLVSDPGYGGSLLRSNDPSWPTGWPGATLDKLFFGVSSGTQDVVMEKFQGFDELATGAQQDYFLSVFSNDPSDPYGGGLVAFDNVRVVDNLPAGVAPRLLPDGTPDPDFNSCFLSGGPAALATAALDAGAGDYLASYDPVAHRMSFDFGDLLVGENLRISCSLTGLLVTGTVGSSICNTASLLTGTAEPDKSNNIDTVCATIVNPFADVSVNKFAPFRVLRTGDFYYSISYANSGAGGNTAANVVITDTLPSQVSFVAASDGGTHNPASRTVTWNIGNVASGAGGSLWIQARTSADLGTVLVNNVVASADNDANPDNNTDTATSTVSQSRDPNDKLACSHGTDLSIPAQVDACVAEQNLLGGSVLASELLPYVIRAENVGDAPAEGVFITDTLDPNVDDTTLGVLDGGTYDPATRTIRWNVGTLAAKGAPGSATQVRYSVRANDTLKCDIATQKPDEVANQAFITFPTAEDPVTPTNVVIHRVPYPKGDVDHDCAVDLDDIRLIANFRNKPATVCPDCDVDGNGTINVSDQRKGALLCTLPRCAPVPHGDPD